MLRFAAAAEILETDFCMQYSQLAGIRADMPQYGHDNTDDELTDQSFLNAYLPSKG